MTKEELTVCCPLSNQVISKVECATHCRFAKRRRVKLADTCFACELITGDKTLGWLKEYEPAKVPTDKQCLKCTLIGSGQQPPRLMIADCLYNKHEYMESKYNAKKKND